MVHRVNTTPTMLPIVTVPALATLGHAAAKHVLEQNVHSAAPSALLPKADKQWKSNLADIGKHHSTHLFTDSYLAGLPARSQWAEQVNGLNKSSPSIHVPRMPLADTFIHVTPYVVFVRERYIHH